MRSLLLTGGVGHPFAATSAELASMLRRHGVSSTIVEAPDWDDALADAGDVDLLGFDALRWRMLADRYDHLRAEHAYATTPRVRAAVEAHVAAGRPILALHTSCICFDDWPRWGEMLGACWDWDRSFHPPLDEISFSAGEDGGRHGTASFRDEVYHGLRITDPNRDVLAWASVPAGSAAENEPPLGSSGSGEPQPVIWRRTEGAARVVVDTLGHDVGSLANPAHHYALDAALAWLVPDGE